MGVQLVLVPVFPAETVVIAELALYTLIVTAVADVLLQVIDVAVPRLAIWTLDGFVIVNACAGWFVIVKLLF